MHYVATRTQFAIRMAEVWKDGKLTRHEEIESHLQRYCIVWNAKESTV